MARLQDLIHGTRAIKRIGFPLVNVPSPLAEQAAELKTARSADIAAAKATAETYPTHAEVGMRVLLPGEFAVVLELALAFAKARGEDKPDPDTSPIYNLGMQIYTLAAATVDPDEPRNADGSDRLFFGANVEAAAKNIQSCEHLTRDVLSYLAQQWELWSDQCNPQVSKIGESGVLAIAEKAVADADFLALLRPGLLFSCFRTLAAEVVSLRQSKSQGGLSSTTSSKKPAVRPLKKTTRRK